jgi:NADPH-dependent 2,4-dienoyl-CoA reductase/sulfur reductase-like enzyme
MNYGFLPQSELARALGCAYHRDSVSGDVRCERGLDGKSSVAEVFVVGDAGGLGGAKLALAQGRFAGARIALELDARRLPEPAELTRLEREIRGHCRFQKALWALFAGPRLTTEVATSETTICRCESLTLGALREAVAAGSASLASVKRVTRAGMGRCQGRYCTDSLNTVLDKLQPDAEEAFFAPRPPMKPVPISLVAGRTGAVPEARNLLAATPTGTATPDAPGDRYANICS